MAKKKNKNRTKPDKPVQEIETPVKPNDDKWIWPFLAVILITGFFAYRWASS